MPHVQAREANVFDELRRLERSGARYDTIVLDPPAFAKNKASIPNALAGYKEINLRAMRLLSPGGFLVTCSCSYNVSEEMFAEMLHEASVDSHTPVSIVEKRMQGRDHPVLASVPETLLSEVLHPAAEWSDSAGLRPQGPGPRAVQGPRHRLIPETALGPEAWARVTI